MKITEKAPVVRPSTVREQSPEAKPRDSDDPQSQDLQAPTSALSWLGGYVAVARPDHWFKNVFMLFGVLLAAFYYPQLLQGGLVLPILWALAATCLIASSNYVLNEILDAPTDRSHPSKRDRPIPSGRVSIPWAYVEWIGLAAAGLILAALLNGPFFYASLLLWVMGIVYNVPPIRSKELPYVDVLSESLNNPLRLVLGWFAISPLVFPPVSLLIAYWMIGAFFMAAKRLAEYRFIGDQTIASAYRRSFRYYDDQKLLISIVFYVTTFALFFGVFIVRYHLELILVFPLVAGFICYYLQIAYREESPAQSPERLYKEKGLMLYLGFCLITFFALMFVHVPLLYKLFNVDPPPVSPLWRL